MRLFFNKSFLLGFSLVCVLWMSEAAIAAEQEVIKPVEPSSDINPSEAEPDPTGGD